MSLRFHIVYVGGTTTRLLPCLDTLLDYTDWEFVLVANGCSADEVASLRARSDRLPDRVEVRIASDDAVRNHGDVLDELLADESGSLFGFMDSDVFATGPTDARCLVPADDEVARCSCLPFWHERDEVRMPPDFEIMSGRFIQTADGRPIGCTYAAVYRTAELRRTLERWGISLRSYQWRQLPSSVQRELDRNGLRYRFYDTAKVANLLLLLADATIHYRSVDRLIHLGGQSGFFGSGWTVTERVRGKLWASFPGLYELTWRVRGLDRSECRSMGDLIRRRSQVMDLLDGVHAGEISVDQNPGWIDDEVFKGVCALAAPTTYLDTWITEHDPAVDAR